ncbi:ATP-dependent Clp protease adaptor ClpS [Hydrotalea sandarakina]|jgi:ATP-dependent Clp protease adaptor protein ClpS|uniref:ATP-dependent Clp protease adaptor protein ClpS n=1 Tax=Hydrotalea sandarakina TaxID=1004304 RepID=A0A2W7RY39_9BACT|nr:ATP-dependent Clp protease adaptor ClpS [Hydrotalea sandarakina]PZX65743.1 ATP-dependent Clp protease adaptor protein ClpS [Hydrotalea sandarakina]
MIQVLNHTKEKKWEEPALDTEIAFSPTCHLIVWNDDVNTFDWVIETLVEVCGHTHEQAEQCALLIHMKGKCAVKNGEYEILQPMCTAILDRGINATIETTAIGY